MNMKCNLFLVSKLHPRLIRLTMLEGLGGNPIDPDEVDGLS